MTIRMSARIAAFAVLAAEAVAVASHGPSKPGVWSVLVAVQIIAVLWVTDRRSAALLMTIAPAALTGVTVAAGWTAVAFAVPAITIGNGPALAAIVAAGLLAAASHRGTGRRLLPLVLVASAGTALLLFLVVELLLPSVPGFVSNSHPPTHTQVTRLVDPVGEFGLFVLLAVALAVVLTRTRIHTHRVATRGQRPEYGAGPNEMVVERAATGSPRPDHGR